MVGPPGTGKTTIIAAVIAQVIQNDGGVLVTGKTNSSVKQVAETLLRLNICSKYDMKLLVSQEYLPAMGTVMIFRTLAQR